MVKTFWIATHERPDCITIITVLSVPNMYDKVKIGKRNYGNVETTEKKKEYYSWWFYAGGLQRYV